MSTTANIANTIYILFLPITRLVSMCKTILGAKVQNIYDLTKSNRQFIVKISKTAQIHYGHPIGKYLDGNQVVSKW